jgi:hypothetical protein
MQLCARAVRQRRRRDLPRAGRPTNVKSSNQHVGHRETFSRWRPRPVLKPGRCRTAIERFAPTRDAFLQIFGTAGHHQRRRGVQQRHIAVCAIDSKKIAPSGVASEVIAMRPPSPERAFYFSAALIRFARRAPAKAACWRAMFLALVSYCRSSIWGCVPDFTGSA